MPAMPKIIDLDEQLAFTEETTKIQKIKLFGREWSMYCDVNSFTLSAIGAGDAGAIAAFLNNVIVEDERADFAQVLSSQRNLTPAKLVNVIGKLIEVAGKEDVTPSTRSPRGATKRTSSPKSAAGSPSVRIVRSTN